MKNLFIIIVLAVLAFIAYQQLAPKTPTASDEAQTPPPETIKAINDLILENDPVPEAAPLDSRLISPANDAASVYFIEPADGATVTSPVTIKFGATNMQIVPAGQNIEFSGHHHILLDLDTLPDLTQALPANDQIIHFGAGQTETQLDLPVGEHTLQMLLGNYLHIPHQPAIMSEKITITVE